MPRLAAITALATVPDSSERISARRIAAAKKAFTTRRVDFDDIASLLTDRAPETGDLVLAEILAVGHHAKIEDVHGRRRQLHVGDTIIVAYGARYAPDQFDGIVPNDLGPCHLLAGGGIAGEVVARHDSTRPPTRILPLGLLGDRDGEVVNLKRYALTKAGNVARVPMTLGIVGTSMNSGKTTVASSLIRGLTRAGLRVGAAKLTGTGSGGDVWSMLDAGAEQVLDFTDVGYATTHQADGNRLIEDSLSLLDHLAVAMPDVVVFEIADGLLQNETSLLLSAPELQARIDCIIFTAGDSLGAVAGIQWLIDRGLPLLGFSGLITGSPLGTSEAERATGFPSFTLEQLGDPQFAPKLCFSADAEVRLSLGRCV